MKKIVSLLLVLIIALGASGQPAQVDTLKKVQTLPADSVAIISIRDISIFFKWFRENVSVANYEKLKPEDILNELVNWSLIEYGKKKKK